MAVQSSMVMTAPLTPEEDHKSRINPQYNGEQNGKYLW
ncbi:hypothetical protein A464_4381 [Salmonella bongori N268-08]|uniref:Uncharacterized protein n=1 Tax=Salmonella bongori N268-08 TaxID=1197719 RepID=S5N3F8_SALBN|nr:hypothetical protein A464_4381 [Salmonella bongori N268-08]